MHRALSIAFCLVAAAVATAVDAAVVTAEFVGDRIFVVGKAADGTPVRFFTDTGGGWNAISQSAVKRLALVEQAKVQLGATEDTIRPLVGFPVALLNAHAPASANDPVYRGGLAVIDDKLLAEDGVLGAPWFSGKVWEFDYGRQAFAQLDRAPVDRPHRVSIGFRTSPEGQRALEIPRVTVTVDGTAVEMMLDTGATATVTAASASALKVAAGAGIATSFIAKSVFDRWVAAHPDWRVIDAADQAGRAAFAMIEVPTVSIGGVATGPVWFTQRPDSALHDFLSQMTDKPVDGALGGSALRYFRVTLDYPDAAAWFEPLPVAR